MINPGVKYPLQTSTPDADFPFGGPQDVITPGDGKGTPYEAGSILGDTMGFFQKLVGAAGITPSGDVETALASDLYDALGAAITGSPLTVYIDSGAADAYDLTAVGSLFQPLSYFGGMTAVFVPGNVNTGNSTVNVGGLGAKKILTLADTEIAAGALTTGRYYELRYDPALDAAAGAFALIVGAATVTSPGVVRTATDTEVNNQTAVDAYVKPGQLGTAAIAATGTGTGEVPLAEDVAADWNNVTFETDWVAVTGSGRPPTVRYRKVMNGQFVHIFGVCERTTGTSTTPFILPVGFQPVYTSERNAIYDDGGINFFQLATSGSIFINVSDGENVNFNNLIPLT